MTQLSVTVPQGLTSTSSGDERKHIQPSVPFYVLLLMKRYSSFDIAHSIAAFVLSFAAAIVVFRRTHLYQTLISLKHCDLAPSGLLEVCKSSCLASKASNSGSWRNNSYKAHLESSAYCWANPSMWQMYFWFYTNSFEKHVGFMVIITEGTLINAAG